jgi:hypothetical protein
VAARSSGIAGQPALQLGILRLQHANPSRQRRHRRSQSLNRASLRGKQRKKQRSQAPSIASAAVSPSSSSLTNCSLETRNTILILVAFGLALAGPTPVIAVGLVSLGTGSPHLIAVAMIAVAVAGFFAVAALPETRCIDLLPVSSEPSEPAQARS